MNKLFLILVIFLLGTASLSAQIPLVGNITTNGPALYPTHLDTLGQGGFRVVLDSVERNNITLLRRREGMVVFQLSDTTMWRLRAPISGNDWAKVVDVSEIDSLLADLQDQIDVIQTVYTSNGTLTADRTITGGGHSFDLTGTSRFTLSSTGGQFKLGAIDGINTPDFYGMVTALNGFVGYDDQNPDFLVGLYSAGSFLKRYFSFASDPNAILIGNGGTGSSAFKGLIYDADYSANYVSRSLVDKGYVDGAITGATSSAIDGSGTANYLAKFSDANTLTNSLIYDDGTNVGIGTSSPSAKLEVVSPSGGLNTGILLRQNANGGAPTSYVSMDFQVPTTGLIGQFFATASNYASGSVNLAGNSVGLLTTHATGHLWFGSGGVSGFINFNTGGFGSANERMRITSTGRVGIGTTSPNELLELSGSSPASRLTNTSTSGVSRFRFYENSTNLGDFQMVGSTHSSAAERNWMEFVNRTTTGGISFWTNSGQRLSILADGKVGIGTGSPASLVDVQTNALGTTQTNTSGILLSTSTPALSAAQQISPALRWRGLGYGTIAGTSQPVDFRSYVVPVQGTTPSGNWVLESSINGGAYSNVLSVSSAGYLGIGVATPLIQLHLENGTNGGGLGFATIAGMTGPSFLATNTALNDVTGKAFFFTAAYTVFRTLAATGGVFIGSINSEAIPTARLQVKGQGATSSTANLLLQNSAGTNLLKVEDGGKVGIGTASPALTLDVRSAAANTTGVFSLANTTVTTPLKTFITNATPESVLTGSPGDIAYSSAGFAYMKETGIATNTGWKKVATSTDLVADNSLISVLPAGGVTISTTYPLVIDDGAVNTELSISSGLVAMNDYGIGELMELRADGITGNNIQVNVTGFGVAADGDEINLSTTSGADIILNPSGIVASYSDFSATGYLSGYRIMSNSAAPSLAIANAGTGATVLGYSSENSSMSGRISFTTGTGAMTGGNVISATFAGITYPQLPIIQLAPDATKDTAGGLAAAVLIGSGKVVPIASTGSFVIYIDASGLANSTRYDLTYTVSSAN